MENLHYQCEVDEINRSFSSSVDSKVAYAGVYSSCESPAKRLGKLAFELLEYLVCVGNELHQKHFVNFFSR